MQRCQHLDLGVRILLLQPESRVGGLRSLLVSTSPETTQVSAESVSSLLRGDHCWGPVAGLPQQSVTV